MNLLGTGWIEPSIVFDPLLVLSLCIFNGLIIEVIWREWLRVKKQYPRFAFKCFVELLNGIHKSTFLQNRMSKINQDTKVK